MRAHGEAKIEDRSLAFQELRQEIQGRIPNSGPFEISADMNFDDLEPAEDDPDIVKRFKLAARRDSRYAVATGPYLQLFGMSQSLRSIYDGGGQLQDGGAE